MRLLLHLPLSPYSRKVRLALAEKGLPFELKLERVWERRPEFLALNPAAQVPVLVEESGLAVADSAAICEYLDEAYPETPSLIGRTLAERVECRRLVAWFDGKFAREVDDNLLFEKLMRRLLGRGEPEAAAIRAGFVNLRHHLAYLGWLAEHRKWLAGDTLTLADLAAAAHLSALDFLGDVDWSISPAAKEWYARVKSRPAFRPLLNDRVGGMTPPAHYANLDF
jgi:glutathione S-transferase